jgi:hypothetical protein
VKVVEEEVNPWLSAAKDPIKDKRRASKSKYSGIDKRGIIDVEGAASILADEPLTKSERNTAESVEVSKGKNIVLLSQTELVRRAFVAPTEQEVNDEFLREKEEAEERDDPTKKKELKVSVYISISITVY